MAAEVKYGFVKSEAKTRMRRQIGVSHQKGSPAAS